MKRDHQVVLSEEGHEHAEEPFWRRPACWPKAASLYDAAVHQRSMHHLNAALRAHQPVSPRPAVRRAGQRSHHRGRVHRAPDDGPALVGRPAPGGRVQGKRPDPVREPDPRLDHLPELLPHVRSALRHDRDGGHGSLRIPGDLRPGDRGGAHAPPHDPRRPARPGLPDQQGKVRRHHRGHQGLPRARPARPRGHDLDRELRAPVRDAQARRQPPAPGPQRQAARARSRNHRPGGAAEDGHHRDQHGRPRHRHRARRQRRKAVRAHRSGRPSSTPPRRRAGWTRSRPSGSSCTTT